MFITKTTETNDGKIKTNQKMGNKKGQPSPRGPTELTGANGGQCLRARNRRRSLSIPEATLVWGIKDVKICKQIYKIYVNSKQRINKNYIKSIQRILNKYI